MNLRRMAAAIALMGAVTPAQAAEGPKIFGFVIEKQEKKTSRRFTLAEWMETREKMKWMDLWLAMNSPSPFEFFAAPSLRMTPTTGGTEQMNFDFEFGAYASITGIEITRRFAPDAEWAALFALRVFGYHIQATHLSLQGGVRSREGQTTPNNAFAGVEGAFYFTRFFGVEGSARHEFARAGGDPATAGLRWDGGLFIDYGALRIFGGYENDIGTESWNAGAKLFF